MTLSSPSDQPCAAVVVAYRSAGTLEACLTALLADVNVAEIVVVDNSSDARTAALVDCMAKTAQRVRVQTIDPGHNLGFAAACNLGVSLSSAPVLAFVNPDVKLTRELSSLVLRLGSGSIVAGGLIGPFGSIANVRGDCTLAVELRRALLGTPPVQPVAPDGSTRSVPQVDGALLLVERATLLRHGSFKEDFPLYYEDVELCWRVRRQGGQVIVHAAAYGTHAGGVSSGANPRSYAALRISRLRWLRLRYGTLGGLSGVALCWLELITRAAGQAPEGLNTRWRAVRACTHELRRANSVRPLDEDQPA